jgi:hypothetical protein
MVGHLLTDTQVHAVMYYIDGLGAGLQVFLWAGDRWRRIYRNDTLPFGGRTSLPVFEDWNGDGIKDIVIGSYDGPTARDWANGALWLTDKSGAKMHYVAGFDDIRYPRRDKKRAHILSSDQGNYFFAHKDYAIRGYKLGTCNEFAILVQATAKVRDSAYEVEWRKNDKVIKSIFASPEKVDSYVPASLKKEVDRWGH